MRPQGKVCSYPVPENPLGVCGKKLCGHQKTFCQKHSKMRRAEYKRARGVDDVKAWRAQHPEKAKSYNRVNRIRRRMGLTRRELLCGAAAVVGTAVFRSAHIERTPAQEAVWNQLQTMGQALAEDDATAAPRIAPQAHWLYKQLKEDETLFARRTKIRLRMILRDTDVYGNREEARLRSLNHAIAVRKACEKQGYWLWLAEALINEANIYRAAFKDPDKGYMCILSALYVLEHLCGGEDPRQVALRLHQAVLWQVRYRALEFKNARSQAVTKLIAKLIDLAGRVDTPLVWVSTFQERSGVSQGRHEQTEEHNRNAADLDDAQEYKAAGEKKLIELGTDNNRILLPFGTQTIALYRNLKDEYQALVHVEHYLNRCKTSRIDYCINRFQEDRLAYGLVPDWGEWQEGNLPVNYSNALPYVYVNKLE